MTIPNHKEPFNGQEETEAAVVETMPPAPPKPNPKRDASKARELAERAQRGNTQDAVMVANFVAAIAKIQTKLDVAKQNLAESDAEVKRLNALALSALQQHLSPADVAELSAAPEPVAAP